MIIAQLGELLAQYPHFYLVDVEGMDSAQTSAMRRKCFQSNVKMVVVKNTMLKKALDAKENDFSELDACLKGTTALLFSETANVPARMIKDLTSKKQEKPVLKAAYAEEGIDKRLERQGHRQATILQVLLSTATGIQRHDGH